MFDTRDYPLSRRSLCAGAIVLTGLVLATAPRGAMAQAGPEGVTAQSTSDRGVTIKVTPKSIGTPNSRWEFLVVLDTHSADLNDDLVRSATLATDGGAHSSL